MSTDENQVFLALQEWYQTDTYNLYQSDTQGVYYSIVLENVRSTKQPEENVLIDILEVDISAHTIQLFYKDSHSTVFKFLFMHYEIKIVLLDRTAGEVNTTVGIYLKSFRSS